MQAFLEIGPHGVLDLLYSRLPTRCGGDRRRAGDAAATGTGGRSVAHGGRACYIAGVAHRLCRRCIPVRGPGRRCPPIRGKARTIDLSKRSGHGRRSSAHGNIRYSVIAYHRVPTWEQVDRTVAPRLSARPCRSGQHCVPRRRLCRNGACGGRVAPRQRRADRRRSGRSKSPLLSRRRPAASRMSRCRATITASASRPVCFTDMKPALVAVGRVVPMLAKRSADAWTGAVDEFARVSPAISRR